jgi:hypothetical protein
MLDGGCNWRNQSELLEVLMRWSPNTIGGSRFFVTKAEYRVSAFHVRDGYGLDAEYPAPSSQVAHSDFRNGSFTSFPLSQFSSLQGLQRTVPLNGRRVSRRARSSANAFGMKPAP